MTSAQVYHLVVGVLIGIPALIMLGIFLYAQFFDRHTKEG